jgi:hypothetical protein
MARFGWRAEDCRLDDFVAALGQPGPAPRLAARIASGVPVYDGNALRRALDPATREALMAEWAEVMLHGAGIVVIERLIGDLEALDAASAVFEALIAAPAARPRPTTSRPPAPTTGSGTRCRSTACATRKGSRVTTATRCSPPSARPGSVRAGR